MQFSSSSSQRIEMNHVRANRKFTREEAALTQARRFVVNYMRSIALYVFTMLKTNATAARDGFRRLCEHRLERRGEVDRERARADDTGNSRRPVEQVTLVLVTVRLELLRGPDRGVFVDVGLAVADAELVHVASLTAAPEIYKRKRNERAKSTVSVEFNKEIIECFPLASAARFTARRRQHQPNQPYGLFTHIDTGRDESRKDNAKR